MQFLETSFAEWTSTRSITNDSGRAGSHRDYHAIELDSEDPPRIYSHPKHHQIVLATSTHQSQLAGENEIHEWGEIETSVIS